MLGWPRLAVSAPGLTSAPSAIIPACAAALIRVWADGGGLLLCRSCTSLKCLSAPLLPAFFPACSKLSNRSPLSSSRRLLGASLANFSHKWEPRSGPPLGPCAPYSDGIIGGTTDLEMPLLPASPSRRLSAAVAAGEAGGVSAAGGTGRRAGRMHRSLSAASGSSARSGASCSDLGLSPTGASAGTAATGERLGVSRSSSVDRLTKYGSSEFSDESPFFPAAGAAAAGKVGRSTVVPAVLNAPAQHVACMHGNAACHKAANPQAACLRHAAGVSPPGQRQVSAPDAHHCGSRQLRGRRHTGLPAVGPAGLSRCKDVHAFIRFCAVAAGGGRLLL